MSTRQQETEKRRRSALLFAEAQKRARIDRTRELDLLYAATHPTALIAVVSEREQR